MTSNAHFSQDIRACLFDLDGTLVDTLGDFELALAAMLRDMGRAPLTRRQIEPLVGKGTEHLVRCVLACTAPTSVTEAPSEAALDAQMPDALASYHAHYMRINGQASVVYPGVSQGLAQLRSQGLPLLCVTNKPQAAAQALLRHTGLRDAFVDVYGGDRFQRRKPDPMPLIKACEALGLPPSQVLMVGDSSNDALAARAAACPIALLSHGYNHGQDVRQAGADAVFDSFDELVRAVCCSLKNAPFA